MSAQTGISWCDSTFNPWIGCTKVSPACDHCYAERDMAIRRKRVEWGAGRPRSRTSAANWKLPQRWNRERWIQCSCGWRGQGIEGGDGCGACGKHATTAPTRRRVFCASLADVFDTEVDQQWRADLFELIASTPNIDWLILTKRIGNVARMIYDLEGLPENVWLGATVVNQEEVDRDVPKLLRVPAAVRFLSIEPMLGPVTLDRRHHFCPEHDFESGFCVEDHPGIRSVDWVICGGESGPNARPMHQDWVHSLRDQCTATGVAFHFKQWGSYLPVEYTGDAMWAEDGSERQLEGRVHVQHAHGQWFARRQKDSGRLLDGRTWDEFPKEAA